jgi:hypothetical protein
VSFDDMHFVYAVLSAAAAALACVVILVGMMRLATHDQPDSIAAMVKLLASPDWNENPLSQAPRVRMPRTFHEGLFASPPAIDAGDVVFALSAVVTREGRVEHPALLNATGADEATARAPHAKQVEDLLGRVARARFDPASMAGLPVSVNMVWIVAHTTVRASRDIVLPAPVPRKGTA